VDKILHSTDFRGQVGEAAAFAYNSARKYQDSGFLPADLLLSPPLEPAD
jgi:hypothetical protein